LPTDSFDLPAIWLAPPARPALARGEVHVWRARLLQPAAVVRALWQTLAPDECRRAERFRFEHDRERFVVGRGRLRAILGCYLDINPGRISFCYNPYGKPALSGELGDANIHFNLSHAGDLALYAFAPSSAVGVDIEQQRAEVADLAIAERFFSPREFAALRALPDAARSQAFFNCWTRKEAYIKARGEGLSLPLEQFSVSLTPGAPAELLDVAADQRERTRWSLRALAPGPGYVAALAVDGHDHVAYCWDYPEEML